MSLMQSTLRITDYFYDAYDPEGIERQGRFQNCVVLVFILHMLMVIAFIKFQEFEVTHPRIIHDVDVSFEFTPPPPPPKPKKLSDMEGANGGSAPAPAPMDASKLGMSLNAPVLTKPSMLNARPIPSRKATVAPPVALTTTNETKTAQGVTAAMQAPVAPAKAPNVGILSTTAPSGAPNAGGAPGATQLGVGTGGNGAGGTGTGQGGLGAGTGEGGPGGKVATALTATRAMGNISPYRKDMLLRLAQNWHPKKASENLIVLLTIAHDGRLLSEQVFQSSGNKKTDKEALKAAEETQFAPLPDWYKGETLTFKVELSKVEAIQQ